MPLLNGLEATRQILKALPGAKVLILSAHGDDAYVETAAACGAVGFLLKQTSSRTCAGRSVKSTRENFLSPSVSRRQDRLHPFPPNRKERRAEKRSN